MTDTKAAKSTATRKPRVPDDAIIHMGKNDEGVSYGGDNNPKRGKTKERFAAYKNGITVKDAKAAGLTASDITYDRDHGFITVTVPETAPNAKAA